MIGQKILTRVLRPERESASRGYSTKFEGRPVYVENGLDNIFFDVVKLPLTPRSLLRLQMLRFFLLRIGHCLGARGVAIDDSCVLRACAKRTRHAARNDKHGELSGKSNSHGRSPRRIKRSRRFRAPCLSIWSLQLQPGLAPYLYR